jgi:hypothetical protein
MEEGWLALPADGRQSETALMIARGVRRLLRARGFSSLTELPLTDGRRADIAAVNNDGEVLIVEIKSSPADFRTDRKWRDYVACCDRLYFAISERTPAELPSRPASSSPILTARKSCAKRIFAACRPRAAARFCYGSPRPPRIDCTAWPIPAARPTFKGEGVSAAVVPRFFAQRLPRHFTPRSGRVESHSKSVVIDHETEEKHLVRLPRSGQARDVACNDRFTSKPVRLIGFFAKKRAQSKKRPPRGPFKHSR